MERTDPSVPDDFAALRLFGRILSGVGWVILAIGVVLSIMLMGRSLFPELPGLVGILGGLSLVAFGQLLRALVAIERNTRATMWLLQQGSRGPPPQS